MPCWRGRQGHLEIAHWFFPESSGHYWSWGGVDWVAMIIILAGMAIYLVIYDPITMQSMYAFRLFGDKFPVMLISGFAYYVLARLRLIPAGRGGYRSDEGNTTGDAVLKVDL